jgi:hypothetical protein
MTEALAATQQTPTREDLVDLGFNEDQIQAFEVLRERYPYIEFLDSQREWNHLVFMKWLITRRDKSDVASEW